MPKPVSSTTGDPMEISSPVARSEFDGSVELVIGDFEETVKRAIHASQPLTISDVSYSS